MKSLEKLFLGSFLTLVSFSSPATGAELKHFWDFEGEEWWLDKVGEAHGAEPTDQSTIEVEPGVSEAGNAAKFQAEIGGGDDYLLISGADLYQPGTEAFSFFFWIRMPDDGENLARGIFDFSGNGFDGVQSLYIGSAGELAFRIDLPGSGFVLAKAALELEDGEWHSVAATYDPATGLELHIDGYGVDASADAVSGSVTMNSQPYIGSFNFTGVSDFKGIAGNIDDFAIYSGVLSEAEITALSTPPPTPEEGELVVNVESVTEASATITWNGADGNEYAVFESTDLVNWFELDDSIFAGPEGGRYEHVFPDGKPDRLFYRVRRQSN